MLVELVAVRPFVRRGSNAWLMATVALGIVADNAVLFTFGKEPRGFPMPLGARARCRSPASTSRRCRSLIPVVGLALAAGAAPVLADDTRSARRCSRWCRTPTPRA